MFCVATDKNGVHRASARRYNNDALYQDIAIIGRASKIYKLEKIVSQMCHCHIVVVPYVSCHIGLFNDGCTKSKTLGDYDGPVILYLASAKQLLKVEVSI